MKIRLGLSILILLLFVRPVYSFQNDGTIGAETSPKKAKKHALIAVIPEDAPPTYFRDIKTGKASGFAVDVMNKIAELSGMRVTYIFGRNWSDIMLKVETGEADLIPGMAITEERKKRLAFTKPLDTFPVSCFVRSTNKTITGLTNGLEVGVLEGGITHENLKENHLITLELYDSYKTGLFDLLAGRIDVFVCPDPILQALAREAGMEDRIKIVGDPVFEIKRAIAGRTSSTLLIERLNKVVDNFVGSPEYQEIYKKWYRKPTPYWTLRKVVFVMSVATIAAVVFMASWRYISIMKLNRILKEHVSDLKRAEENRIHLETAIISAGDAIVLTDSRGTIKYVNPAFERITGFKAGEAVGRDLHILDSGKHDDVFYGEMQEALKRDGVWSGRLINKKKDKTLYEEECTYSVVKDQSGNVLNHVAIKRDITEKLRLQSIAAAMETMNNIGYIFSGVRHEIGNPINSIGMMLNLIKMKIGVLDKRAIENYIDQSLNEIFKVEYLLRTLKNFNMFEKLEVQNISIKNFLEKFISLVTQDFRNRGIEIDALISPDVNFLSGDPRALQQVLLNLFTNSSDALQGRDNPRIAVNVSKMDSRVRIRVEDNGHGMTDVQQENLFKPFHTTKAHGTGLGMVIVKKMLTAMSGTIEVTSRKDVGTIVDILLPAGKN